MQQSDFEPNHPTGWDYSKGDYKRHSEATNRHTRKLQQQELIKRGIKIALYIITASLLSYYLLKHFIITPR